MSDVGDEVIRGDAAPHPELMRLREQLEALEALRRLDSEVSEQLLRALSSALSIRDVFPRVSEIARSVLAHERLTMSFHDQSGNCVLQAVSNDDGPTAVRVSGVDPTRLLEGTNTHIDDLRPDKPQA